MCESDLAQRFRESFDTVTRQLAEGDLSMVGALLFMFPEKEDSSRVHITREDAPKFSEDENLAYQLIKLECNSLKGYLATDPQRAAKVFKNLGKTAQAIIHPEDPRTQDYKKLLDSNPVYFKLVASQA